MTKYVAFALITFAFQAARADFGVSETRLKCTAVDKQSKSEVSENGLFTEGVVLASLNMHGSAIEIKDMSIARNVSSNSRLEVEVTGGQVLLTLQNYSGWPGESAPIGTKKVSFKTSPDQSIDLEDRSAKVTCSVISFDREGDG